METKESVPVEDIVISTARRIYVGNQDVTKYTKFIQNTEELFNMVSAMMDPEVKERLEKQKINLGTSKDVLKCIEETLNVRNLKDNSKKFYTKRFVLIKIASSQDNIIYYRQIQNNLDAGKFFMNEVILEKVLINILNLKNLTKNDFLRICSINDNGTENFITILAGKVFKTTFLKKETGLMCGKKHLVINLGMKNKDYVLLISEDKKTLFIYFEIEYLVKQLALIFSSYPNLINVLPDKLNEIRMKIVAFKEALDELTSSKQKEIESLKQELLSLNPRSEGLEEL